MISTPENRAVDASSPSTTAPGPAWTTGYRHTIDDRLSGAAGDDLAAGGVIPKELSLAELLPV